MPDSRRNWIAILRHRVRGAERLLAGNDYPDQIGSRRSMVESSERLDVSDETRAGNLGMSCARLLDPITMLERRWRVTETER